MVRHIAAHRERVFVRMVRRPEVLEALRDGQVADHGAGFGLPTQLPAEGRDGEPGHTLGELFVREHVLHLTPCRQRDARLKRNIRCHAAHPDGAHPVVAET